MKFQKTIDLWANDGEAQDRIISGELKLQAGQWVQCGSGPKARFVGVTDHGTFWVAHSEGSDGTKISFKRLLKGFKGLKSLRQESIDAIESLRKQDNCELVA